MQLQLRTLSSSAAHVNPPWVGKCASADASAIRGQIADGVGASAWTPVAIAFIGVTGGLRPPLLCWSANVCRRNNDFCNAQTHVRKSGGRQPAVDVSNAVAIANTFVQRRARQPAVGTKRICNGARLSPAEYVRPPRLAHASRSCCTVPVG
jgi:hypothetical protein